MRQRNRFILAGAVTLAFAGAVMAGIINGAFEAVKSDPWWTLQAWVNDQTVWVEDESTNNYLVIAGVGCGDGRAAWQDPVSLTMTSAGGYATLQFDARNWIPLDPFGVTYGGAEVTLDLGSGGGLTVVTIPRSTTWTTHKVSLPMTASTTNAKVNFVLCQSATPLHIDNVSLTWTANNQSTLTTYNDEYYECEPGTCATPPLARAHPAILSSS